MQRAAYLQSLDRENDFHLRRAVERLREGLFDPVAVRLLTAREERLNQAIDQGFQALEKGAAPHLCVCGAYGQGKSHSLTYIQDRALGENFATSMINLDPREIPFHDFRQVYRALVANLRFPDTERSLAAQWRAWAEAQVAERSDLPNGLVDLLPEEMPHLFRAVLVGLAQKNVALSEQQRTLKKHARFRPREFPYLLTGALAGDVVPVARLRHALKYRQVPFYRDASLVCRGAEPYLQMVRGLARLFRQMGYRGWVLLFDEGESMVQVRVSARARSYQMLHRMLAPEEPGCGLYPIVAFTEDFFQRVEEEDYDRARIQGGLEMPYFERNYADAWRYLKRYQLENLSAEEWGDLVEKLMHLHARAYQWQPPEARTRQEMAGRLAEMRGQETRFRLKALVDQLDLVHQEQVL